MFSSILEFVFRRFFEFKVVQVFQVLKPLKMFQLSKFFKSFKLTYNLSET